MGQAPTWLIGKGVQMKVRWKSADQTEKQRIRLHVACILLVWVLGQNVTGQNVTDTIADKILWGQNVIDRNVETFCPRHFVNNILWQYVVDKMSWTKCRWQYYCQRHFVRDILSVTFCPATLVVIQLPCSRPDKNGGSSNPNTGNSSNDRL